MKVCRRRPLAPRLGDRRVPGGRRPRRRRRGPGSGSRRRACRRARRRSLEPGLDDLVAARPRRGPPALHGRSGRGRRATPTSSGSRSTRRWTTTIARTSTSVVAQVAARAAASFGTARSCWSRRRCRSARRRARAAMAARWPGRPAVVRLLAGEPAARQAPSTSSRSPTASSSACGTTQRSRACSRELLRAVHRRGSSGCRSSRPR